MQELAQLYQDLDAERLRVSKPSRFIFLCGGPVVEEQSVPTSPCMRDYLYRKKRLGKFAQIVLAERAVELFRDTSYDDLISFEEDIAKIASLVLVISESPGSLAELGAFATAPVINQALRIISHEQYEEDNSFIRHGPMRRVKNRSSGSLAFFPWKMGKNGIVKASANRHFDSMKQYILDELGRVPKSQTLNDLAETGSIYVIYWIIYLSLAITIEDLASVARILGIACPKDQIENYIYCMRVAGWVDKVVYSDREYFYSNSANDPFDYAFRPSVDTRDSARRKVAVREELLRLVKAPKHVRDSVVKRRENYPEHIG